MDEDTCRLRSKLSVMLLFAVVIRNHGISMLTRTKSAHLSSASLEIGTAPSAYLKRNARTEHMHEWNAHSQTCLLNVDYTTKNSLICPMKLLCPAYVSMHK